MSSPSLKGLLVMNVVLAVFCAGAVLAVSIAVFLDWRERRQRRALVPSCWPPPGVSPEDAYALDLQVVGKSPIDRKHGKEAAR